MRFPNESLALGFCCFIFFPSLSLIIASLSASSVGLDSTVKDTEDAGEAAGDAQEGVSSTEGPYIYLQTS